MTTQLTTLPSGLRVVTDAMPGAKTVSLGAWVDAGTRFEPKDAVGISHFLEHMVFKGTAARSARDIAEHIEDVGGQINAYTSRDHTAFFAKVLADDQPLAVDILSDILINPTFDPEELEREKDVVVQEIYQANDTPDDIVFDHVQAAAYFDQPLGRPVLGTEDTVRSFNQDRLRTYITSQYTAPRTVVAAAGRVDHDEVVAQVAKAFDGLPTGAGRDDDSAVYTGGNRRDERHLEQAHVVFGFDGVGFDDPQFYAATALSVLLGEGMSSRLFQEVREKRGLAYAVYSSSNSFSDSGLFSIYAGTSGALVPQLCDVVCQELRGLAGTLTEPEVTRAKVQMRAGLLMSAESTSARCAQAARHTLVFGAPESLEDTLARIDAISVDDVRSVTQSIFASAPTIAGVGVLDGLPEASAVAASLQ